MSGVDRCCRSSIVSFFSVLFFFVFVLAFDAGVGARVKQSNGVCRVVMDRSANQRPAIAADCLAPYFSLFFVFLFVFFLGFGPPWWIARFYPRNAHVQPSNNQSNPVKPSKIQVKTEKKSLRNPMKTCTHRSSPCLTRKTERNRVKPSKITKNSNKKPWEACPTLVAHMNQTRVFKIITKCSRVKPIKTQ